jgi:virginiamycin B lyase
VAPAGDGTVWYTAQATGRLGSLDPRTGRTRAGERFDSFPLPTADGRVRQLLGRPGELWGAESAVDKLVVARSSS